MCPVYLLKKIIEEGSCKVDETEIVKTGVFRWRITGNPFKCPRSQCSFKDCWQHRLQRITAQSTNSRLAEVFSKANLNHTSDIICLLDEEEGAVCFGSL